MNLIKPLAIIQEDPWLSPYQQDIKERWENFQSALKEIEAAEGSLLNFATAHQYYGIHFDDKKILYFILFTEERGMRESRKSSEISCQIDYTRGC